MVTLTRPRSQQEARAFYAQIAKALDDLGVEHGQDFTLTAATTYTATLMDVAVTHTPDDAITGG